MKRVIKTIAYGIVVSAILATPLSSLAYNNSYYGSEPSAGSKFLDLVIARPLLFGATVVGTGLFVVTSPFTIVTGNDKAAADALVVQPGRATFVRPLGESLDYYD